jgi:hypothetical protein
MPGNPLSDPHWAPDLADTVTRIVGDVRDKTTNNIILLARGLVFGILAAIVGVAVLVLTLTMVMRGIQSLLELGMSWPRAVYVSYFIVGGICCLVGVLLMRKRHTGYS